MSKRNKCSKPKSKGQETNGELGKWSEDILGTVTQLIQQIEGILGTVTQLKQQIKGIQRTAAQLNQQQQQEKKGSDCESLVKDTDCKELRDFLEKEQLDVMEKHDKIRLCKPYEDFFDKISLPLQYLLGLKGKIEGMEETKPDYLAYLVQDKFAAPLSEALKKAEGKTKEGKFRLTPKKEQGEEFDRENKRKKFENVEIKEMVKSIDLDRSDLKSSEIALKKEKVVQGLGRMIEEFQNKKADGKFPVDSRLIDGLSIMARTVLELNEIYPMFIEDAVKLSPELKKQFSELKTDSIPYPGFFIKNGEKWELLGNYVGMGELEK